MDLLIDRMWYTLFGFKIGHPTPDTGHRTTGSGSGSGSGYGMAVWF